MKVEVAYLRWLDKGKKLVEDDDKMIRLVEVMAGLSLPVDIYPSMYEIVDTFEADKFDLERWWRQYNVVDGAERPVQLGVRSMCVGDAFVINGTPHFCLNLGWSE